MTNTEIIATIRNEVERLIKESDFDESANLYSLLSFLSTLESEKPMQEGLEEELDRFIASGKSVTVEDCGTYKVSYHDFKKVARHFAEWQKAKDDRYVDTIYQQGIEKGKDDMKEQMMKKAVEYEVWDFSVEACPRVIIPLDNKQYRNGDKVRIIIVKEEEL